MTQSMDVLVRDPVRLPDSPQGKAEKSGSESKTQAGNARAETVRKGSSFLAIIEKMVAGAKDGAAATETDAGAGIAGRGADGVRRAGIGKGRTEKGEAAEGAEPAQKKTGGNPKKNAGTGKSGIETHLGAKETRGISGASEKRSPGTGVELPVVGRVGSVPGETADETAAKGEISSEDTKSQGVLRKTEGKTQSLEQIGQTLLFNGTPQIAGKDSVHESKETTDSEEFGIKAKDSNRSKKERNAVIGVIDERSTQTAQASMSTETGLETSVEETGSGTAEMNISFRGESSGNTGTGMYRLSDGSESKAMTFQEALSQQLRSNAQDFVRAGQIVLRDNESGSIRLNLHPETLGSVRINLELKDKKITGRIVVATKEAYEAFKESLDGISQAFTDSGFDSAGFDLSWSGSGKGEDGQDGRGSISSPFYASAIPDVMSTPFSADSETGSSFPRGARAVNVYA